VGGDHGIVGIGSLRPSSEDGLTNLEGRDARTERFDGSRKLTSRRERQGNWPDVFEETLADLPINWVDTRRIDADEHLADMEFRAWDVLHNQLFRTAVGVKMDCSHGVIWHGSSVSHVDPINLSFMVIDGSIA